MTTVAREPETHYTPCPEGLHQAVCVDVVDLGMVTDTWGTKPKIRVVWQIEEEDEHGRRFTVRKHYNLTLHKKASLRKDLEAWRGRAFTASELKNGFDVERLIGANCQIQVIHNIVDDGKTYANVNALLTAQKNAPKLRPLDYTREKDRPTDGNGHQDQAPPPDDLDEIPFAWLLPLLVTVGGSLVA